MDVAEARRPFSRRGRGKVNDEQSRHDDNANGPNAQTLFCCLHKGLLGNGDGRRGVPLIEVISIKTAGWIETADSSPVCPAGTTFSQSFPNQQTLQQDMQVKEHINQADWRYS